jgi:hypothetical protein
MQGPARGWPGSANGVHWPIDGVGATSIGTLNEWLIRAGAALLAICTLSNARPAIACWIEDRHQPPTITITASPHNCCYGQWAGSVSGQATNIDSDSSMVVLYCLTDQWYVQPGTGPGGITSIHCPGGDFSNATRGGCRYATILARRSWSPPSTLFEIPPPGGPILAWASSIDSLSAPKLSFGGRDWIVKTSCGSPVGPGFNWFSDGPENVWVDANGRMHLRLTYRDGRWYCAEVLTDGYVGYGTYRFETTGPVDALDPNIVFGAFFYSDNYPTDEDEIDIEFSRWGVPAAQNAQYVVQPFDTCLRDRFSSQLTGPHSTHEIVWAADSVRFSSWQGGLHGGGPLIRTYTYRNPTCLPVADAERLRFNLWLFDTNQDGMGDPPSDGQEVEVVVSAIDGASGVNCEGKPILGLDGPWPSPATGELSYRVRLAAAGKVRVHLLNAGGRQICTILEADVSAGDHEFSWHPETPLPRGIYFLRIEGVGMNETHKFVMLYGED